MDTSSGITLTISQQSPALKMGTSSDITPAEVSTESKKSRRGRRKQGKRHANNARVVQNMDQVDSNTEHAGNGKFCMVAKDNTRDTTLETDSVIKPNQEHQKPNEVPTTNGLKDSAKDRREKKKGKVIKKSDGTYGPKDMDHADILSNLSLADTHDGLDNGKINKTAATEEESGCSMTKESVIPPFESVPHAEYLSCVAGGAPNLLLIPRHFAAKAPVVGSRRKLLILDVNGLLADIVMPPPRDYKADGHIAGRGIFKRPFYNDFLKFCCERFEVGIWSSRSKRIIDLVVDYLLGDLKHKLVFCWVRTLPVQIPMVKGCMVILESMDQCTDTGFKTLENRHKPLFLKELRKLWEKHCPDLPWEKGDYDESNTLLIDDSPYKALLNPIHTAIFPYSYHYGDKSDNSLGPGGDLRVYLEGLAKTENVQKHVEQHQFGQRAIDETSSLWGFYSRVLDSLSAQSTQKL